MEKLKQFDKIFGISYEQDELEKMFVNKIHSFIYEPIESGEHGMSYDTLIWKLCLTWGLNDKAYITPFTSDYRELHYFTGGNFIKTLKLIVTLYEIYKPQSNHGSLQNSIDIMVPNFINQSPAPLGIQWHSGMFYKDEIPEISGKLIQENFDWLGQYPLAKSDMQIALRNYSAGGKDGILDNMYKAVECVVQKVTGMNVAIHRSDVKAKLFQELNVTESWKGIFEQFIIYTNDISRHGKNADRHNVSNEEIESCFFLSLTILRLISKKIK